MKTTSLVACLSLAICYAAPARGQTHEWTRQLGTSSNEDSLNVSADRLGGVYISGWTQGDLDGTNAGDEDAFLSKYDAVGVLQWTRQLGTSSDDENLDVSADGLGSVYTAGWTLGSLEGTNAGGSDAFVAKYRAVVPEPATGLLLMLGLAVLIFRRDAVVSSTKRFSGG